MQSSKANKAEVELSIVAEGPDIVFSVRNQGPPILPDLLPTIPNPFVRDLSPEVQLSRRPGTIGLGLSIAHEIVPVHGGTIDVTSSAESGTVFTVCIPHHRAKQ